MAQLGDSIAALTSNVGFINAAVKQVTLKPQDIKGIAGLEIDIILSDNLKWESDITDHYVEDNTVINDHVSLKPETLTMRGIVGELTYTVPAILQNIEQTASKLSLVSNLMPEYTIQAQALYSQAKQAIQIAQQTQQMVENAYGLYKNLDVTPEQTKQSQKIGFLRALWMNRNPFSIVTPWGVSTNWLIQNLDATQADTISQTEITITFKKIRFATAITTTVSQERAAQQTSSIKNKGLMKGKKDQSVLKKLTTKMKDLLG